MPNLPTPPLPLLITGVAGVAGYNALHHFRRRYPGQVIAIRRTDNWPLKGEGILPCDGDDKDQMRRLFDRHQFRSVLNCEGTCKLKSCELDPAMAQRVNIDSVVNLLEVASGADVRLVHLSIDLVYSGTRGGSHVEEDPTDPVTVYGKTMAQAEQIILRERPDACQLRISLPMGVSFNGHAGAIDWIQSRFKKQKPATLYYDEVRTPTYTDCLNPLLQRVLAGNLSDPDHLMGCNRIEAGPIPPRAGDVSMDSGKLARALGHSPFDPWPHDDALVPTHHDWHRERPPGEKGSAEYLRDVLYHNPRRKRTGLAVTAS
jgi:dTDP-4-dehydrorhamnose reductase